MDCFVCSKMVAMVKHPKNEKKINSVPLLRPRVLVTDQKLSDAYDILTLLEAGFVVGFVEGIFGLGIPPWKEANLAVDIFIYMYI